MNKVILLGRLVADPELRYTQSNIPAARFRLAVNRPIKQEGQPTADFFMITAWRGTAEFVSKYFRKGQQVLVEGHLMNNSWTDHEGKKRYNDVIIADHVYFADSKHSGAADLPQTQDPEDSIYNLNDDDEDLPF